MARIWRGVFGLIGLAALALQYLLMWTTPRLDALQVTLNFFSYFTILTNVVIMTAMLIPAVAPRIGLGRALAGPRLRGGVTLYATVVALIYHFLLHATWEPQGWLLLAMASTLAGNLTLLGSIANLIVAEGARGRCPLTFAEYLKTGVPVTLLTLLAGTWLLG